MNSVEKLVGTPCPIGERVGRDIEGVCQRWKKYMGPTIIIKALLGDVGEHSSQRINVDIFLSIV